MIPRVAENVPSDMRTDPFYNAARYVGKGGYYKGNTNYQCVNYAIGRTCEISGKAVCYYSGISTKAQIEKPMMNRGGYGNAVNWWTDTLWEKGTEAKVGAVMVYGKNWGGGYGHVRIVEKVDGDRIFYSAGNEYRSMAFNWIDKPKISANGFLGYIYNPFVDTDAAYEAIIGDLRAQLQQAEELLARQDKALQTAQDKLQRIKDLL